ncbi:MAG TPA: hypothetical protein VK541_19065, partial [Pedobacter sp.]|uniref:hypothetical protein n=1 Tax=Pedobacter sp. TaxID=1411316 RepID=UPI002B96D6C0
PVSLFLYAMLSTHGADRITFGIIAIIFLLPAIIDFIANNIIRLKAAIIMSEEGLALSPVRVCTTALPFCRYFCPGAKK